MCHQTTYVGCFRCDFLCSVLSLSLTLSLCLSSSQIGYPSHTFSARYLGSATMEVGGSRHASLVASLEEDCLRT